MSKDLQEIFDLATLRRAWGTASSPAAPTVISPEKTPQTLVPPLRILGQLEEAIEQEFGAAFPVQRQAFAHTLGTLRGLIADKVDGGGSGSPKEGEEEGALERHLDELEDLLDALSLATPTG